MKQLDCTDVELAAARLFIAAMRNDHPVMVEYEGADNAIYVYHRGLGGQAMTVLCLTRPCIADIDQARESIETRPGGGHHA